MLFFARFFSAVAGGLCRTLACGFHIVYHEDRLIGRFERIAPQRAFGVDDVAMARHFAYGNVDEFIVHETDDHLRFAGHGRVYGVVAEALAVDGIVRRRNRRSDLITGIDIF